MEFELIPLEHSSDEQRAPDEMSTFSEALRDLMTSNDNNDGIDIEDIINDDETSKDEDKDDFSLPKEKIFSSRINLSTMLLLVMTMFTSIAMITGILIVCFTAPKSSMLYYSRI
ncbi:unnamed protein product [Adineta steineri]|uniref:Uncharacterized protein n=1 Tax=Adineta steineri TaxID=433720 RepID=A0A820KP05_9BILA|nr:unnamed protein product [Adineta steineri]